MHFLKLYFFVRLQVERFVSLVAFYKWDFLQMQDRLDRRIKITWHAKNAVDRILNSGQFIILARIILVPDRPNFFELSIITDIRTYIFYATVIQFKKTFCYIKEYHINYHFTERYLENIHPIFFSIHLKSHDNSGGFRLRAPY